MEKMKFFYAAIMITIILLIILSAVYIEPGTYG